MTAYPVRSILLACAVLASAALSTPPGLSAQEPPAPESRGNVRTGMFGALGFGAGFADCLGTECDVGGSGNARIGGTMSDRLRLAVGTNGHVSDDYEFGAFTFQVLINPGGNDFYLLVGAGAGTGSGWSTVGLGLIGGLGYDFSINRSGSLALNTFLNFVYSTDDGDCCNNAEFFQAGLGLTFN